MKTTLLALTTVLSLSSFACSQPTAGDELAATEDALQGTETEDLPETVTLSCEGSVLGRVEITLADGVAHGSRDVSFDSVTIKRATGTETLSVDGHAVKASYSLPFTEADRPKGARVSVAAPPSGMESWPDVCYAKAPNPGFSIGLFAPSGKFDPQWSSDGPSADLLMTNPRVQAELHSGIGWPTFGPDMLDGKQECKGTIAGYQGPRFVDLADLACTITTSGRAKR